MFSSFLLAAVLKADGLAWLTWGFQVALTVSVIRAGYRRNASMLSRALHTTVAIINIIGAVAVVSTPFSFHYYANYANRVAFFTIVNSGILGSLALLWPLITRWIAGDALDNAGAEKPAEQFLYALWALVVGAILPWMIPLKESYSRDVLFKGAVLNSLGIWFLAAALAGGLGWLLAIKGTGGTPDGFRAAPEKGGSQL
jgi:hypothetical protein